MTAVDTITVPALVHDMSDAEYHADPIPGGSLSSSGARRILEAPAKFHYDRTHQRHSDDFDFGHVAHKLVLGVGADVVVVDAPDWRTKEAKAAKAEARSAGHSPILAKDYEAAVSMDAAVKAHPIAGAVLAKGAPEVSAFWRRGGISMRARYDWLTEVSGRPCIVDYKTTTDASNEGFAKQVANHGYHQQNAWYVDGYKCAVDPESNPAFLFIAQEKWPPYIVNVIELDPFAVAIGRARNERAIEVYRRCTETGYWPGYSDDIEMISLPRWAEIAHENEIEQSKEETPW